MDEVQIVKVAAVLAEENPLGSRADTISDLGYRIEAITSSWLSEYFGHSSRLRKQSAIF